MSYNSGLEFSDILSINIDDLLQRIDMNKASLLILDGGIGEGKTTLAVHIADYIHKKKGLGKINFKESLAMGGEEFLERLRICYRNELPVIIYDEAGDFNRRGALTRFNAMINRTFETFRAFKILVILCLPSFHVLDNELFDKQIPRVLLHVKDRTMAQGNFYGYSLYRMRYIKHKIGKLIVPNFAYTQVQPNFYGHFHDLPKTRAKELDKVSTTGKLKVLVKSEIKIKGLLGYPELSAKLSRSIVWVRVHINKLKIKPRQIINRAKYFNEEDLNRLSDHLEGLD